jgi:hypothetical protein
MCASMGRMGGAWLPGMAGLAAGSLTRGRCRAHTNIGSTQRTTRADAARAPPGPMPHSARAPAMPKSRATHSRRWPSTSPTWPQRSAVILWLLGLGPCDCENPIHEQGAGPLRVSDVTSRAAPPEPMQPSPRHRLLQTALRPRRIWCREVLRRLRRGWPVVRSTRRRCPRTALRPTG